MNPEVTVMACPTLADLPSPPAGKTGWPWTEASLFMPEVTPQAEPWPRITIVTPSFNQASFLEETIRSVLLQGYPNLEYLIFDGGSSDGSVEIIKKYSRWIDYWISAPDGGQSSAINSGLKRGTGEYASWLNSDDLLCQNALGAQVENILASGHAPSGTSRLFLGVCRYIDVDGNLIGEQQGKVHTLEDLLRLPRVWRALGQIVQPEVLFPLEKARALGGVNPDNHLTMDYELWGRFLLDGASLHYTKVPFAMFREHGAQKTSGAVAQTRNLVDASLRLLDASTLSSETKAEIRNELMVFMDEYQIKHFKATGRLARLGLPPSLVARLRQFAKNFK